MTMLAEQPATTTANDFSMSAGEGSWKGLAFVAAANTAPIEDFLPLDAVIGVGFGMATLTRDGEIVYEEGSDDVAGPITVAQAEELVRSYPEHDWCIHLVALLDDRHYRRVGNGLWKLYRRGYGLS